MAINNIVSVLTRKEVVSAVGGFVSGFIVGMPSGIVLFKKQLRAYAKEEVEKEFNRRGIDTGKDSEDEIIEGEYEEVVYPKTSKEAEAPKKQETDPVEDDIEIIDFDEYGAYDDFRALSIEQYTDGKFVDPRGRLLSKKYMTKLCGAENLDDNGVGSVYLRNHTQKIDVELVKNGQAYQED